MKKIFQLMLVCYLCSYSMKTPAAVEKVGSVNPSGAAFVMCTQNNKTCTIGEYTMTGSNSQPLYVRDGIVCTEDRKMCTNGYQVLTTSSSEPIYIAEDAAEGGSAKFVMCTPNKKLCAIGKHTMRGTDSQPLYIGNGVVCTANKKRCTNGFTMMRSSTPMY